MSFEMQDVAQESGSARAIEAPSAFSEAYGLLAQSQFKSDKLQSGSQTDVNQMFGTIELFDSSKLPSDVRNVNHQEPEHLPSQRLFEAWAHEQADAFKRTAKDAADGIDVNDLQLVFSDFGIKKGPPDANGRPTVTEYPNGVKTHPNGQTEFPAGSKQTADGTVTDAKGNPIYKKNADGTATIFHDGAHSTEYPNGVRITVADRPGDDSPPRSFGLPEGNTMKDDGTVVDKNGKPLMKQNEDGSVQVFTDKGTYTETRDGQFHNLKKKK